MEILKKKEFIPEDIKNIIKNLTLSDNFSLPGSYGLKARKFWADVDVDNTVKINLKTDQSFQKIILFILKNNDYYFMDCKIGYDKNIKIIDENAFYKNGKIYGYDFQSSNEKLEKAYKNKYISDSEYKYLKNTIVEKPSLKQFDKIIKTCRIHILRWQPSDIIKGYVFLRDNSKYTLKEAIRDDTLFKLDVVVSVRNLFIKFEIVYHIRDNKGLKINKVRTDPLNALNSDMKRYLNNGKYFMALKRAFSLASYKFINKKNSNKKELQKKLKKLLEILNGDLGILNKILTILECLIFIIKENHNLSNMRVDYEINNILDKLSNIYKMNVSKSLVKELIDIISLKSNKNIPQRLFNIYEKLEDKLNINAKKFIIL